jgi:hypothetical protein
MVENNEISTGPGRYALGVPNAYGNAAFVPDPTIRMQKWGASHIMSSTKTDVESDLRNIGRPSTRVRCGQYTPTQGEEMANQLTPMPEAEFPQTFARLVDPPCTLRSTGWNRWEWLGENPQTNVMIPFEWGVDVRNAQKDVYYNRLASRSGVVDVARQKSAFCDGSIYVDPAVPVARPSRKGEPANFTDTIPGSPQVRTVIPVFVDSRPLPQTGSRTAYPVPTGPVSNPLDRQQAQGVIAPPPFF